MKTLRRLTIGVLTTVCVTWGLWYWIIDIIEGWVPLRPLGPEG